MISIAVTAFYWRNDTHNLCHLFVFTQNQLIVLGFFVRGCSSFFKLLISYIASLDKCHTNAFNAYTFCISVKKLYLYLSNQFTYYMLRLLQILHISLLFKPLAAFQHKELAILPHRFLAVSWTM